MTHDPRTQEEIYQSLKDSLTGKITKLTNFTDRSFNYVWTQAFAEEVHELEVLALTSEFAGWIDFVGGPVTEDQLEDLDLDDKVTAEEINEIMEDEYLDEYVKIVGITRFEGQEATGTVTIDTQDNATTIPEGTEVATAPDADGNSLVFETTEQATTGDGVTSVSGVSIEAVEVGEDHNVTADTIVQFPDPPLGVRGVTNPEATTGGEDVESNDELRARAKQQVEGASEGGTVEGIKAYLRQNVDAIGAGDVIIEEFVDNQPPFVDVIVDGGTDEEILAAIEASRPAGIRHNLIRPQVFQLGVRTDLLGTDIIETDVEDEITTFLLNAGIDQNFYEDELIRRIMERDEDILNIDFLDVTYDRVTNERFNYNQDIESAVADDGGTLTDQTTDANDDGLDDMTLLPQSPAVGDAYYFGNDSRFSQFDLFISTGGAGTWDVVWEYWNGSNWVTLSNVTDNTNDFRNANLNSVSWDIPSDWVQATVDGKQEYYVRARVDSFTDITTQPLGRDVEITGRTDTLDLTYESTNGSITVEGADGILYDEGVDFTVEDYTGDSWPETIKWDANAATPDPDQDFFVDYDVTTFGTNDEDKYETTLVRDEYELFQTDVSETFTYNVDQDFYLLDFVPFDGTSSITDGSGDTYVEGTDYEIVSKGWDEREEEFTYSTDRQTYHLQAGADETTVEVTDENGTTYIRGTDYTMVDTDSDGVEDAVQWDTNNNTPDDQTDFTVSYSADNGLPQTIDWTTNTTTPDDNEDFTITYDKEVYHLEYDLIETPKGEIRDASGDIYEQDVDYIFVDHDADDELDSLQWLSKPSTMHDGEEFYVTYLTEGDIHFGSREKADPSTDRIRVNS